MGLRDLFGNNKSPAKFESHTYKTDAGELNRRARKISDNCYVIEELNWSKGSIFSPEERTLDGYKTFADAVIAIVQWDSHMAPLAERMWPNIKHHAAKYAQAAGVSLTGDKPEIVETPKSQPSQDRKPA